MGLLFYGREKIMTQQVKVQAKVHFSSSSFGTFTPGEVFMLPADVAERYMENGFVQKHIYEIKPHVEIPRLPTEAGMEKPSLSLPAGQASPKGTSKKPRKKQTKSSASTTR